MVVEVKRIKWNLVDLEDRTRRKNLRFAGFSESGKESWCGNEEKVRDFMQNKLGIKNNIQSKGLIKLEKREQKMIL